MEAHSVWAEIDLQAIAHNLGEIRRLVAPQTEIMAVVKADGYGHGALQVARTALEHGATRLAVARGDEALSLREAGIDAPILVFGGVPAGQLQRLIGYDLTFTIFSRTMAETLSAAALQAGRALSVHLKVDTGMGRLGFNRDPLALDDRPERRIQREILAVAAMPGLELEGIYTHFASADASDKTFAHWQFRLFMELLEMLSRDGLHFPLRHAANSAAILDLPDAHLDLVRAGIMLYGLSPTSDRGRPDIDLRPAMQFKTRISQIKEVPAGFPVSYGSSYRTMQSTRLATVSVGYADGLNRLLSSRVNMLVKGVRVPVVGRICMDQSVLDVGAVPGVRCGDEVVVFGRQGAAELPVGELAALLDTINYEIVSTLTARVPRIYPG
ncbi:alanine racemase [Geothermobacter hydrogeniphilus]|uniref:Alanine racemase n=1 Tax=Geothermobacter hydrogeniphilus TaxID=1969733 RepID=A0A1X0XW59_9BACT|nr:alanine racemase [Geothermobacter hydrogeniphilus]ORJ57125.1 alanine racemase [Geothermobacter hydrogeniphilus]